MKNEIIIIDKGLEFIRPYVQAALPAGTKVWPEFPAESSKAPLAVLLSGTDVYSPGSEVIMGGENAPVDPASAPARAEADFMSRAAERGIGAVVLRCAPIVGTGMQGAVRRLAEDVFRGIFFHFPGNETRMSVVHATDVARAISLIFNQHCPAPGSVAVYNLTDGDNPTIHDLAEALAHRMDDKRISTLSTRPQQLFARVIYGRRFREWTTERTFDGSRLCREFGFRPTPVCEYLRTHIYDDTSL